MKANTALAVLRAKMEAILSNSFSLYTQTEAKEMAELTLAYLLICYDYRLAAENFFANIYGFTDYSVGICQPEIDEIVIETEGDELIEDDDICEFFHYVLSRKNFHFEALKHGIEFLQGYMENSVSCEYTA